MSQSVPQKDLVVLAADADILQVMKVLLCRSESLGIAQISFMVPAWSRPMTVKPRRQIAHWGDAHRTADFALAKFARHLQRLFARVVQSLIELAEAGSEEPAILEYIQNRLAAQGAAAVLRQGTML